MRVWRTKNSKENLCDHCFDSFPECKPQVIEFGDGIGNDNVTACTSFTFPSVPYRELNADKPSQRYLGEIVQRKEGF